VGRLNIKQVEAEVSRNLCSSLKSALQKVGYPVPEDYRVCVSLMDAAGRKKRSTAGADNWSPSSGKLEIWLEPGDPTSAASPLGHSEPTALEGTSQETANTGGVEIQPALAELFVALDHAESTPGWSFVSLKKFRDEILPTTNHRFLQTDSVQQNVLRHAIENRLILTSKVANPKDPRFPVTTIRLNRLRPEVQAVVGTASPDLAFQPVRIKGEPLSATILRERR